MFFSQVIYHYTLHILSQNLLLTQLLSYQITTRIEMYKIVNIVCSPQGPLKHGVQCGCTHCTALRMALVQCEVVWVTLHGKWGFKGPFYQMTILRRKRVMELMNMNETLFSDMIQSVTLATSITGEQQGHTHIFCAHTLIPKGIQTDTDKGSPVEA